MRRITRLVAALLAAVLLLATGLSATADDVIPAPWRGDANTTIQEATFSQSGNISWESVTNPFGTPDIWMYGDVSQWNDQAEGRSGVISWGDSGNGFSMDIPNNEDANLEKRIWVQVTYYGAGPTIWKAVGIGTGGGSWAGLPPLEDTVNHSDGWVTDAREMVIQPNPSSEFVGIRWTGAGMVDQIVVETICVPEPATTALGFAALAMLCAGRLCRRRA